MRYHRKVTLALVGGFALLSALAAPRPAHACLPNPYIASICMFAGNFAPRGWAYLDGQLINIYSNPALFSLIGTIYGGNGRVNFALPDLRGRVAIHPGDGPGLTERKLGQKGGAETVKLTTQQIPAHTHVAAATARANSSAGTTNNPTNAVWAESRRNNQTNYSANALDVNMAPTAIAVQVQSTGGGQAHDNMPPFLGINYIIALVGIYPSRN